MISHELPFTASFASSLMAEFTSAFLSKGKDVLKDVEANIAYSPFGNTSNRLINTNTPQNQVLGDVPESIKQWRREYDANIEKKDANESRKNKEMKESAEKVLLSKIL